MLTARPSPVFPPEIVREVLLYLPVSQLAKAIKITRPSHLEQLTERLEYESSDVCDTERLSLCLRSLTLNCNRKPRASLMRRFQEVVPKLKRLQHLDCPDYFDFNDVPLLLQVFKAECPQLTMLTLSHRVDDKWPMIAQADEKIFVFENMTHLGLGWPLMIENDDPVPKELVDMIEKSPDLVTLALDTRLTTMLCHLKNPLKKLRHMRLQFEDIDQIATTCRAFFKLHPHITELELLHDLRMFIQEGEPTSPKLIQELFPAVTRLSIAPDECIGFATSKIAEQLQVLSLSDEWCLLSDMYRDHISKLARVIHPLPKLRELYFIHSSHSVDPRTSVRTALDKILAATPALMVLDLACFCLRPTDLLELLQRVPLLRKLGVRVMDDAYTYSPNNPGPPTDILADLVAKMRETCQGLREIRLSLVSAPSQNGTTEEENDSMVWQDETLEGDNDSDSDSMASLSTSGTLEEDSDSMASLSGALEDDDDSMVSLNEILDEDSDSMTSLSESLEDNSDRMVWLTFFVGDAKPTYRLKDNLTAGSADLQAVKQLAMGACASPLWDSSYT